MPAENPCFKCTHHAAGCHDDCRAYKDWQDRHIAERRRIRTEQEKENMFRGYCVEISRRNQKFRDHGRKER